MFFLNPPADCLSAFQDVKIFPLPRLLLILPQASRIDAVIGENVQILSTKREDELPSFLYFFQVEQNGKLPPFPLLNMMVARI